jgi:hypothetical protein
MNTPATESPEFTWTKHPEATQQIQAALAEALKNCPSLNLLSHDLHQGSGTKLFDWIDRISVNQSADALQQLGFETFPNDMPGLRRHREAKLPDVIESAIPLSTALNQPRIIAIKVESLVDFLVAHQRNETECEIVGRPGSAMRRALIERGGEWEFWVIERHGGWHWNPTAPPNLEALLQTTQELRCRPRNLPSDDAGFDALQSRLLGAIERLGRDRACDEFFAAERAYWMGRNYAGQLQYMRQQRYGMGWANHDHHTYRSSRHCFHRLISIMELLGLQCRERFYAGRQAGWGAQVMEHPGTGIVVFADVDLAPDEIVRDFAHQQLPPRDTLGTVGLWCALHGEAILQAGMHHLECQFDFTAAREQLTELGAGSMNPFTDLPHLRQGFTLGQRWSVREDRIQRAQQAGWITVAQADTFRRDGAIGSHLEILQRNDGFKGFNPKGISDIILETDPRSQHKD